jgi:hypothetical protein
LAGGIVLPLDQTAPGHQSFYGTSENVVKTQVGVALSVYVLVAIVKRRLGLDLSLYKILQILSITIFEKTPILDGVSNFADESENPTVGNQLRLFGAPQRRRSLVCESTTQIVVGRSGS